MSFFAEWVLEGVLLIKGRSSMWGGGCLETVLCHSACSAVRGLEVEFQRPAPSLQLGRLRAAGYEVQFWVCPAGGAALTSRYSAGSSLESGQISVQGWPRLTQACHHHVPSHSLAKLWERLERQELSLQFS